MSERAIEAARKDRLVLHETSACELLELITAHEFGPWTAVEKQMAITVIASALDASWDAGAALAAAQRVAGEMPPEFEALDAIINDSRYSSELIGIRVRNAWPQIKAALALSPGKVEGWREIESAPKDGTHFLACDAKTPYDKHWTFNQRPPTVVHWFQDGFYTSVNEAEPMHPFPATHWQPLDSPPISSRAEDS